MKKTPIIILLFLSYSAFAVQRIYYSEHTKNIEINSVEETLLVFSSPPVAYNCQPSTIIEVNTLENYNDFSMLQLPEGAGYINNLKEENPQLEKDNSQKLAQRFLKVTPQRKEGSALCAFKLASGDSMSLKIYLNPLIQRPIVELKSIYKGYKGEAILGKSVDVFSKLVSGKNITAFYDMTPKVSKTYKSKDWFYRLTYYGTDSVNYNGWIFEVKSLSENQQLPEKLKNYKMGNLYYSAFSKTKVSKGQYTDLYILSRKDITINEVMEMLP